MEPKSSAPAGTRSSTARTGTHHIHTLGGANGLIRKDLSVDVSFSKELASLRLRDAA